MLKRIATHGYGLDLPESDGTWVSGRGDGAVGRDAKRRAKSNQLTLNKWAAAFYFHVSQFSRLLGVGSGGTNKTFLTPSRL